MYKPVLFLALIALASCQDPSSCVLSTTDGRVIDLNGIFRSQSEGDFKGDDQDTSTGYNYVMNVCGVANTGDCAEKDGIFCQYKNGVFETAVARYATDPVPGWQLNSPANPTGGVKLVTANGEECYETTSPRTSTIVINCDPDAPITSRFSVYESGLYLCDYHATFSHPNACPIDTSNVIPLTNGVPVDNLSLQENGWVYFNITVGAEFGELKLVIRENSNDVGWLSLYARRGALPTRSTFDRADTTYGTNYHVLEIRSSDFGVAAPLKAGTYYVGVYAQGSAVSSFSIVAYTYYCPNDCSGRGICNTQFKACSCNEGYVTNEADCSASIVDYTAGTSVTGSLRGDHIAYYRIEIEDVTIQDLFIEVTRDPATPSALPTVMVGLDYFPTSVTNDGLVRDTTGSSYLSLTVEPPTLRAGTWIVAVVGSADQIFNYTFKARVCNCQSCCSDHGTCVRGLPNWFCVCDPGYNGFADCSAPISGLTPGSPFYAPVDPYNWHYFTVYISPETAADRVDLEVSVSKASSQYDLIRLYANAQGVPTQTSYIYSSPLPLAASAEIVIPHAELGYGEWFFGVYNQAPVNISVTAKATLQGYCDCGANGHGTCNGVDPTICVCEKGWIGLACDKAEPSSDDGVEVGTVVAVIILLFVVALVGGICAKPYIFKGENQYQSVNE